MIRRFNHTGRISIPSGRATVTLRRVEGNGAVRRGDAAADAPDTAWCFDLKLDLGAYRFPADSRVRVEAWRGNTFQRWDWGRVGAAAVPAERDRILRDVPATSQFRVSVIAAGNSGRLLGLADKLRPRLPVESLLPLMPDDLGGEVWRLDYGRGDDIVVLKVNRDLPDFDRTVRADPAFRGLVMPQVLRSVLERALLVDREDPEDPEGRWSSWFDLARSILPDRDPPSVSRDTQDDEIEQADRWIEEVVAAFSADKVKALGGYCEAWKTR
ncbi:hypothetical protein [Candidatus Palauibacter sp.]|uniref:hypothetical protein n=1 Tax=Candidatus Palauibacter sp. TaxID=3101350 RepID=UPI003D1215FD